MKSIQISVLGAAFLLMAACSSTPNPDQAFSSTKKTANLTSSTTRFWVSINDQPANPWNTQTNKAMTWRQLESKDGIVLVGGDSSSSNPTDGTTNAYSGDANITQSLPMLCLSVDNSAQPTSITTSSYGGWARGTVKLTSPVAGNTLTSKAVADQTCAAQFGTGWRMAEFHDGFHNGSATGWAFYAKEPTPTTDNSLSYLDNEAREFLTQAGWVDSIEIGGTKWVNACTARAQQGAVTFNSGKTEICTYSAPPGWTILETSHTVDENLYGRGSYNVSTVNGPVTVSTAEFGSKFKGAIELAAKVDKIELKRKLELEYQRLNGFSWSFDGNGSNVRVQVTANGGAFRKSVIQVSARARLLRVY
jgi:hypothetical protein